MSTLALHIIEELLRLNDEGKLSKICKVYTNNRISSEYRAEPKVQVGGPCVLVTYGYNTSNSLITVERTVETWTQQCQDDVDAALPPSPGGTPPGGIASVHDHQVLAIVDTGWTLIPNFANRTTLVIQNNTNRDIYINSDNLAPLTEGILISPDEERQYEDTGPEVDLYLVSTNGPLLIDIEQLA